MSTEKKTQHKDIRDVKAFKAVGQGVEKVGKIKFISEFKDFISKGNVMDMAVGMIVGAAFTAIVTSLVNNILMPALGMITGQIDFSDLKIVLKAAVKEGTEIIEPEVAIGYGAFINSVISFLFLSSSKTLFKTISLSSIFLSSNLVYILILLVIIYKICQIMSTMNVICNNL